ncbi:MAG: GNAT family N-acetyltransferase [Rhodospirillales bacterium]
MRIRDEGADDTEAISALIAEAFAETMYSDGSEPAIVDGLRGAGALTLSLVAETEGQIAGHIAFSPVTIGGMPGNWFGLGPLAVGPAMQGQGIGAALVRAGLERLRASGAAGCVVFGDPAYYRRFGFAAGHGLAFAGAPAGYFMALPFAAEVPAGEVRFHTAFDVASPGGSG